MSGLLPIVGGVPGSVLQLAAGALSGVFAMTALMAVGIVPIHPAPTGGPTPLAVLGCFGTGSILALVQPNDQLWVTARSADGKYVQVFLPGPVEHYGWVDAAAVELQGDGSGLPVAGCNKVADATGTPGPTAVPATLTPIATPTATPTARVTAKPTPAPTAPPAQAPPPTDRPTPTPNVGPVFTLNPPQVGPASIGTNPLGTGYCGANGTTAGLKTAVTDPDGVVAIQLWIQKPGSSSYVLVSAPFSKDGAYWYASIDTASDKIDVAGKLLYRAVAIDAKGAKTTSKTGSLTIFRCDTEATISGIIDLPFDGVYELSGCGGFVIPWRYTIGEPDGLSGVTLKYTITHTGAPTLGTTINLTHAFLSSYWRGSSVAPPTREPYRGTNTVSWSVTTTDRYGGSTATRTRVATVYYGYCPA